MADFFSTDNPIFSGLDYIVHVVCLSLLWILFSLPVFTIGASSTALYYTVTKVLRHNRSYVFREFWQSFKSNFKQSTAIWLIYGVIMMLLYTDIRILGTVEYNAITGIFQYALVIMMVIVSAILIYALAYTARFVQNIRNILMNSLLMSLRHLPKTFLIIIITLAAGLLVYVLGIAFCFAPAVAAVLDSIILESIFVKYMSEDDQRLENLRNHPEQYEYMNHEE